MAWKTPQNLPPGLNSYLKTVKANYKLVKFLLQIKTEQG